MSLKELKLYNYQNKHQVTLYTKQITFRNNLWRKVKTTNVYGNLHDLILDYPSLIKSNRAPTDTIAPKAPRRRAHEIIQAEKTYKCRIYGSNVHKTKKGWRCLTIDQAHYSPYYETLDDLITDQPHICKPNKPSRICAPKPRRKNRLKLMSKSTTAD